MAVREILKMGDPRLLRVAQKVQQWDTDALHLLVTDLLDTMRINIEKSTQKCIVVTTHINITEEDVDQLITAIELIAREYGLNDATDDETALARGCDDSQ
jgi:hypothetical protein